MLLRLALHVNLQTISFMDGIYNRIVGVMVRVLVLSAVDHGFEPRSGQTKDYTHINIR
jgi:hypothetical protein